MRQKKSRSEVNRDVRRILVSSGVDTSILSFQVYGREIYLYGTLLHGDGSEFSALEVESLLGEFAELGSYNITGDTTNWSFSHQGIRRLSRDEEEEKIKKAAESSLTINGEQEIPEEG